MTINFSGIADFLRPDIEAAIRSVLERAEPTWSVSVLLDKNNGNWNIGAQPGDGEPFDGVLNDSLHSVEAIQNLLAGWYEQYEEWKGDVASQNP